MVPAGGNAAADIVEKPVLRPEPADEVVSEGLDDVVVRLHFCKVGTILEFFEAHEPFHAVEFPARFFGYTDNVAHRRVGKVAVDFVAVDESQCNVMEQAAPHPLFFGQHEGVEGVGGIGGLFAETEKERFGLGGIGTDKETIFEEGILTLGKGNNFGVGLLFKDPGNGGEKAVGSAVVEVSVHGIRKKFRGLPVVLKVPVPGFRQAAVAGGEEPLAGRVFRNFCLSR